MRLKDLFTVPAGEKVTEKCLRRVLVSSICSILLCMTCLVSTTWAWFTVSIQNTGNIVEIAKIEADISVTNDNTNEPVSLEEGELQKGVYTICVGLKPGENSPGGAAVLDATQPPVYVVMTVKDSKNQAIIESRLFTFNNRNEKQTSKVTVNTESAVVIFSVLWKEPLPKPSDASVAVTIGEALSQSITDQTTEPAAGSPTETTAPAETGEPSTAAPSAPQDETTGEST